MHGLYQIKVQNGHHGTKLVEYYACTHPAENGGLIAPDGHYYIVKEVRHILKNERNGGGPVYAAFDHVLLIVV